MTPRQAAVGAAPSRRPTSPSRAAHASSPRHAAGALERELTALSDLGLPAVGIGVDGEVRLASEAARELLGAEELASLRLCGGVAADLAAAIAELRAAGRWQGELSLPDAGGGQVPVRVRAKTVHDDAGRLAGFAAVMLDDRARLLAERLEQAGAFWQATLDSLAANVAVLDEHGTIVAVNESWRRFAAEHGMRHDALGVSYTEVCRRAGEESATLIADHLGEMLAGERERFEIEYPCHDERERRWFLLRATRFRGPGERRVVLAHEDVSARRIAQEQLAVQATLLDEVDASIVVTDLQRRVLTWNSGAERLYGWTREEALGRVADALVAPDEDLSARRAAFARDGRWAGEFRSCRKDGSTFTAYARNRLVLDGDGHPYGLIGVSIDVSERKETERELLAARNYLRAVSDSMAEAMYTVDTEGRLTYMNAAAQELLGWTPAQLLGAPVHDLVHVRADGSPMPREECPISAVREHGRSVRVDDDVFVRSDGTLLPVAYTAAPFATDEGIEGCVVVFEDIGARKAKEQRLQRELERLAWVSRVQSALAEDRLVLHAQPIVDLRSGEVTQRELLVRMVPPQGWEGEERLIAPGAFLPAAEEHGLIGDIDRWVIDRAVEAAAAGTSVELNVSGPSVSDPALVEHIAAAIARSGADPRSLTFEITETTLVTDERAARAFVEHMHRLGCGVALDDFGTGYGTFTYLKQLPIDYLKIDIEFVRDLAQDPASRNVVEAIVSLARSFGMKTVAEGVEDDPTLELLRHLGVDYAQGFHIGRPAPFSFGAGAGAA